MLLVDAVTLFRTDLFLKSDFVNKLCEDVGQVFTTTDTSWGAHAHFTTFFGVIVLRPWYKSDVMHDLYVLHELWHRKTIKYDTERTWLQWSRDLINSEFQSSITSEVLIYLQIPELRALTFPHEIWADRFLKNVDADLEKRVKRTRRLLNTMHTRPKETLVETKRFARERLFIEYRQEVIVARLKALNAPQYDDFLEHQIWNYGRQNIQWCRVWSEPVGYGPHASKPAFRVVNEHMSRPDWRDTHNDWLAEVTPPPGGTRAAMMQKFVIDPRVADVPFAMQAEAFAKVYEESVAKFGNDVLTR